MELDLIIRAGSVIDGTGAAAYTADIGVKGDRIAAIGAIDGPATREIDADGLTVTPGFVDIHTHLDAQLAWDPIGTSSCWHGITSVVMGNCGVTFAPVKPEDVSFLAEMMESVEDIPAESILEGLPFNWTTYGGYLDFLDSIPKGVNVGGMVGHCAVRWHAMGERSLEEAPATQSEIAAMCELVDEAISAGALGFSTSRTLLHTIPDGRAVPGTYADPEELLAIGDAMAAHGAGVFEAAPGFERAGADGAGLAREVSWMGDLARRSGRPVTFGLAHSSRRPELYRDVLDLVSEQCEIGGTLRPQTTARSIGIVLGIAHRTPWDRSGPWRELRAMTLEQRLGVLDDPVRRSELIEAAQVTPSMLPADALFILDPDDPKYRHGPDDSLAAEAARRGVSAVEAFIELSRQSRGKAYLNFPALNDDFGAIEDMLSDPNVVMGLADSGAHVGQIMDASQPTFFLSHWARDTGFFTLEEAVRRLTTDTADLFGLNDRGRIEVGAKADLNAIDIEGLGLEGPEYVHDFPGGAGRLIQRGRGYEHTFVNGTEFMSHGEHTGALEGDLLRSCANMG